jgi:hypothetical protein
MGDVVDVLPIQIGLRIENNLSIKSLSLIASEIEDKLLARLSINLKPTMLRNVLYLWLIKEKRSLTKCRIYEIFACEYFGNPDRRDATLPEGIATT